MANGNGEKARFDWLHLFLGITTLALMVATVSGGLLGQRVSVDSENEFREMVKRRLVTLESADAKNFETLDRHREQDRKDMEDIIRDIGRLREQLTDIQARTKDLEQRLRKSSEFKPMAPGLHEALRVQFTQAGFERPRVAEIEE